MKQKRKKLGWGGARPGAGRPRLPNSVSHHPRERFSARFPIHARIRADDEVALGRASVLAVVRDAIAAGGSRKNFRVVEWGVRDNRLHLLVEATNLEAIARGMQGLISRMARAINKRVGRTGKVFPARYVSTVLRTPAATGEALAQIRA